MDNFPEIRVNLGKDIKVSYLFLMFKYVKITQAFFHGIFLLFRGFFLWVFNIAGEILGYM